MSEEQPPFEDEADKDIEAPQEPVAPPEEPQAPKGRVISIEELRQHSERTAMSETDMTVREVAAALKDEDHPRHAEAVEINRETAEMLRPTLDALTKSVMGNINPAASVMRSMRPPSFPRVLRSPVTETFEKLQVLPDSAMPKPLDLLGPPAETVLRSSQPTLEAAELRADIEAVNQRRWEREAKQDEQAELSVQTLQAMAALLEQAQAEAAATRSEMEAVKRELSEGNRSGGRLMFWTLIVAGLTLLATIGVPVVTWWLGQQD